MNEQDRKLSMFCDFLRLYRRRNDIFQMKRKTNERAFDVGN